MSEREPRKFSRREVFRYGRNAAVGMVIGLGVDQVPRLAEFTDTTSDIIFPQGQRERLGQTDSLCLFFGGATVRSSTTLAEPIIGELETLGAVGCVEYAKSGLDPQSIVEQLKKLQGLYHIKELSIYGSSLGTQVAGEVLAKVKEQFTLGYLIMDSTPPSFAYTDQKRALGFVSEADTVYDGGFLLTAAANIVVYHNPLERGTAYPGLAWEQLQILRNGEVHLGLLAEMAVRDRSKVAFLTTQDPEKDLVIDALAARNRLREIFPHMGVYTIGGN